MGNSQNKPKLVEALKGTKISHVAFGGSFAVALSHQQEALLWGATPEQLDIGSQLLPASVETLRQTKLTQVDCGRYHIAVLTSTGKVLTWGSGVRGQLGLGDKNDRNVPWVVKDISRLRATQLCCGTYHTMALTSCGRLFTWGDNQKFTLGHTTDRRDVLAPRETLLPEARPILLLASGGLTCGVLLGMQVSTFDPCSPSMVRMPRIVSIQMADDVSLNIVAATWNINAQSDPNLTQWLSSACDMMPDIVAVGFQEIIQLSSHSLAQDEALAQITKTKMIRDTVCKFWSSKIKNTLSHYADEFCLLKDIRLAGVYLAVFVKKSLRNEITEVRSNSTKVGVLGKIVSVNFPS